MLRAFEAGEDPVWLWLSWELGLNALTPVGVLLPILTLPLRGKVWLVAISVFSGVAIDFDHALAAGSLEVNKMIGLANRPPTHSLLFLLAWSAALRVIGKSHPHPWLFVYAGTIGLLTHLARDSVGPLPIFYPYLKISGLPWILYPTIVLIAFISSWGLRHTLKKKSQ